MKVLEKNVIDKYIKKEIPPIIREVSIDLINYLSKAGFNVIKYINKVNKARFEFFNSKKEPYRTLDYYVDGEKTSTSVNWDEYEGFFVPIIVKNKENKIFILEEVCAFNLYSKITIENKMFKQKIIHELLHLFSASQAVREKDEEIFFYNGVEKIVFCNTTDKNVKMKRIIGIESVNEAITEFLSSEIYKEIYDKNFFVIYEEKDGFYYPYLNQYYIMTGFMRLINLFANLTTDISKLLYAYLNNDLDYYLDNFEKNIGIKQTVFKQLIYDLENYMLLYCDEPKEEFEIDFKEYICPILETLSYNLCVLFKNLDWDIDKKRNRISKIKKYIEYLFSYPIFSSVSNEMANYLADLYNM